MSADFYQTIEKAGMAQFSDRGSKFFGYALPLVSVDDFRRQLALLRKEHPKATHHCFAYRLGTDGTVYRVSDDGEPSGSAGRPLLGQIDSRQLTQVLIVVVRYFGGTQLGVPGLIHAYKTTAALALDQTPVVQKPVLIPYRLEFDYTRMNDVMRVIKQFDCLVTQQDNQLFCRLETGIPKNCLQEVLTRLTDIREITLTPVQV